jgi:TonB family protein
MVEKPPEARMESSRRRTLIGRVDQDLRLRMVAEGWRQKVEQNAPFDVLQAAKSGPYENPVVTVALRRDGSLESVVINRSSGVVAIDNAVRRILLMLSPFAPFPPDVAVEYDVIEIRRVWTFDVAVRLLYGGR